MFCTCLLLLLLQCVHLAWAELQHVNKSVSLAGTVKALLPAGSALQGGRQAPRPATARCQFAQVSLVQCLPGA
jgi:hypothetical protein